VARDVSVSIEVSEAVAFRFAGGTLYSDYLSQEDCKISYRKGGVTIEDDEVEQHEIGQLCLRLFVYLDKSSNARGGPGVGHGEPEGHGVGLPTGLGRAGGADRSVASTGLARSKTARVQGRIIPEDTSGDLGRTNVPLDSCGPASGRFRGNSQRRQTKVRFGGLNAHGNAANDLRKPEEPSGQKSRCTGLRSGANRQESIGVLASSSRACT
jgi:hypothetical protein